MLDKLYIVVIIIIVITVIVIIVSITKFSIVIGHPLAICIGNTMVSRGIWDKYLE